MSTNWDLHPYGMSDAELAQSRECQRGHQASWEVVMRNGNVSAFNGGRFTPSAWSLVRCGACRRMWRTRAAYVGSLPDAPGGTR